MLEVAYDGRSKDLLLRWKPQPNVTMYNIQLFTCGKSMLMEVPVNSSCSVFQLMRINISEYGQLSVTVQGCAVNGCGIPASNVAIDFANEGMKIFIIINPCC